MAGQAIGGVTQIPILEPIPPDHRRSRSALVSESSRLQTGLNVQIRAQQRREPRTLAW